MGYTGSLMDFHPFCDDVFTIIDLVLSWFRIIFRLQKKLIDKLSHQTY